ncbi:hypothetical protein [Ekhidna sp.]
MKPYSKFSYDPAFLESRLKDVYNKFFPFGTVTELNKYMRHDGVIADFDLNGNPVYKAVIRNEPLRIEVHHIPTQSKVVAWQMSGKVA